MKPGDEGKAMAMEDGFMHGSCGDVEEQFCIQGHVYGFIKRGDSYTVRDQMDINRDENHGYHHNMDPEFFHKYFQIVSSIEGTVI